jgi:hypothetical protein
MYEGALAEIVRLLSWVRKEMNRRYEYVFLQRRQEICKNESGYLKVMLSL